MAIKVDFGPTVYMSTPVGVAVWPHIDRPSTTFEEQYQVDLRFDPNDEDWIKFMAQMSEHEQSAVEELGNKPTQSRISPEVDKETGEETGMMLLKASLNVVTGKGVSQRPKIMDSALNPVSPCPKIGGGSKLCLSLRVRSTLTKGTIYMPCDLIGVQIIKLVEYGGGDDFVKREGFVAPSLSDATGEEPEYARESGDY